MKRKLLAVGGEPEELQLAKLYQLTRDRASEGTDQTVTLRGAPSNDAGERLPETDRETAPEEAQQEEAALDAAMAAQVSIESPAITAEPLGMSDGSCLDHLQKFRRWTRSGSGIVHPFMTGCRLQISSTSFDYGSATRSSIPRRATNGNLNTGRNSATATRKRIRLSLSGSRRRPIAPSRRSPT